MAAISVFDIFKIGIGPSSSHTVGPMKAARAFVAGLEGLEAARIRVTLFGSLAWTGKGHGTDTAVLLGLAGHEPETIDPDASDDILASIRREGRYEIDFNYQRELERHTNGMTFAALDEHGNILREEDYFSLGGGFIARGDEPEPGSQGKEPPFPFTTSESLLNLAAANEFSIAELVFRNELTWRSEEEVIARLNAIHAAMLACIDRGLRTDGVLPGKI
ncbi:MAG: serine dehydratase beta chain, partial [Woeseiaceae bacterium]